MGAFSLLCVLSLMLVMGNHHVAQAQDSPQDYVNSHNTARSSIDPTVHIPNIVWDNKIAAVAQNYANQRKDCQAIPSANGSRYGENFAVSTGELSGSEAVKKWVDEKAHYNHYANRCEGGECLHYTQVIWKTSVQVGCGKVKCDNGGTFIACNYYPRGNIKGLLPY